MAPQRQSTRRGTTMAGDAPVPPGGDPLDGLADQLRSAAESARRRVAEAAQAAGTTGAADPAAGWQLPRDEAETAGAQRARSDLDALALLIAGLRDLVPEDLRRRLAEALRELLLALRALIDWYLERVERRRSEPAAVEDIPIA